MTKPSTDTQTEKHVEEFRREKTSPRRLTLRFLALLQKKELAALARRYRDSMNNHALPIVSERQLHRFYRARFERVQSERRLRGHIK